ncbi:cardiotrophin-1 isoform X1 [Anolis sagrei]|uniref:cardiotrophin-1 isoform X1 n=1 Tax=Anolis sagrei TaxID=38937 RepID=UPI0035212DB2
MEVLPVDVPKNLSSSSSRSHQEIVLKIEKTRNMTLYMQEGSEQLLSNYVSLQSVRNSLTEAFHQEEPFGDPDFNPSPQPFPGLPLPTLSTTSWLDLSDPERLQQNFGAFSNLPEYLTAVKLQQVDLNPEASELHDLLETSSVHCLGLANNLKAVMASLGILPGPVTPAEPPGMEDTFIMKFTGYLICHLYRDWVKRCHKDMALLAAKYPA